LARDAAALIDVEAEAEAAFAAGVKKGWNARTRTSSVIPRPLSA